MNQNIAFFWDNASIHVGKEVSQYLKCNKDIRIIKNIQYEPENNGIEFVWAKMKYEFRKQLTKLKIDAEKFDIKIIIKQILNDLSA